jgi:hypothetical protein
MAVIVFLLSLITLDSGLLIFFFQASLAGLAWFWTNLWMIQAIFSGSMVWIILLSLLALAVSSLVKWRVVASGALLGMFFVPRAFGEIINDLFLTRAGHLISFWATMNSIWRGLFGTFRATDRKHSRKSHHPDLRRTVVDIALLEPPLWASWLVIALICAVCVWLLARKVRAYEVIK